jgi:phage-related protein
VDELPVASAEALIALKASAYLNMLQRKEGGEQIDSKHIKKHKNDVLRLTVMLTADSKVKCHDKIKADISQYIQLMKVEQPDVKAMFKEMGLDAIESETLLAQLQSTFLSE